MSEHQRRTHEQGSEQLVDNAEIKARQKELLDESKKEASEASNKHQENLDEIRNEIVETASSAKEMGKAEASTQEEPEEANIYWNSHEYRELAFKQFMGKVRKHLSGPDKVASKVFHQPLIEKASELGSKTIARPSGVLVGSIFSFIASLLTFIIAKRNNYDMTYSVFIVSFLGGFLLGIIAEFTFRGLRSLMSRD